MPIRTNRPVGTILLPERLTVAKRDFAGGMSGRKARRTGPGAPEITAISYARGPFRDVLRCRMLFSRRGTSEILSERRSARRVARREDRIENGRAHVGNQVNKASPVC